MLQSRLDSSIKHNFIKRKKITLNSTLDSLLILSDFKISVIVSLLEINHFHPYSTMEAFRWRLFLIWKSLKHSWKLPIKDLIPRLLFTPFLSLTIASLILLTLIAVLGGISHCPAGTIMLPPHCPFNLPQSNLDFSMPWNLLRLWEAPSLGRAL